MRRSPDVPVRDRQEQNEVLGQLASQGGEWRRVSEATPGAGGVADLAKRLGPHGIVGVKTSTRMYLSMTMSTTGSFIGGR
jgi:hypothetical protein